MHDKAIKAATAAFVLLLPLVSGALAADESAGLETSSPSNRSTQSIILQPGLNLVSWSIDTPCDDVSCLIGGIVDHLALITSYDQGVLTYNPAQPAFSTLVTMDHLHGYWFRMTQTDTLVLSGTTVNPATTPLDLFAGWNLISYLPDTPESTTLALGSIITSVTCVFGFVNGGLSYYPGLDNYSTQTLMEPGRGYWVRLNSNATLTYPVAKSGSAPKSGREGGSLQALALTPSTSWINVYRPPSQLLKDDIEGMAGIIEAFDPGGTKCGEAIVKPDGSLGLMPIYQDDQSTPSVDEGANPGDVIHFKINGVPVCLTPAVTWSTFGGLVALDPINYKCGDANGSNTVTISDAVFLINYIFAGGQVPSPLLSGDVDCNCMISISDVVYLIQYIFAGGAAPCAACT